MDLCFFLNKQPRKVSGQVAPGLGMDTIVRLDLKMISSKLKQLESWPGPCQAPQFCTKRFWQFLDTSIFPFSSPVDSLTWRHGWNRSHNRRSEDFTDDQCILRPTDSMTTCASDVQSKRRIPSLLPPGNSTSPARLVALTMYRKYSGVLNCCDGLQSKRLQTYSKIKASSGSGLKLLFDSPPK